MDKCRRLLNRETVLYLVFGVATTAVNYAVFFPLYNIVGSVAANGAAFAAAVVFAFAVNKVFVFESKSWSPDALKREVPSFLSARAGSFLFEEAGLFLCESVLNLEGVIALTISEYGIDWIAVVKVFLSVIVMVLNYVFCKFFVFKKSEKSS